MPLSLLVTTMAPVGRAIELYAVKVKIREAIEINLLVLLT